MPIFLAVPLTESPANLKASIESHIPSADRLLLQHGRGWLIRFDGTTTELSNKLEITGQAKGEPTPIGSTLLTLISSYYGRGPTDMWEWMSTRMQS